MQTAYTPFVCCLALLLAACRGAGQEQLQKRGSTTASATAVQTAAGSTQSAESTPSPSTTHSEKTSHNSSPAPSATDNVDLKRIHRCCNAIRQTGNIPPSKAKAFPLVVRYCNKYQSGKARGFRKLQRLLTYALGTEHLPKSCRLGQGGATDPR